MQRQKISLALIVFVFVPILAHAVEKADFKVHTTEDLLDLCTASPGEDLYAEAINYCHGYLIGVYHYYEVNRKGTNAPPQVCMPESKPSREEAIDMFIQWAKTKPQYHKEVPAKTEFRFLMEKWPCD